MSDVITAAKNMDWQQVVLNGGPPCFHLEGSKFCGRAQRWPGHDEAHKFVGLDELLAPPDAGANSRALRRSRKCCSPPPLRAGRKRMVMKRRTIEEIRAMLEVLSWIRSIGWLKAHEIIQQLPAPSSSPSKAEGE